ncbi:MAG TPA: hypothetical protein VK857_05775 [Desulforhopalus sp.]|nr:hypothetical protein [Desulforhopalus sp.]
MVELLWQTWVNPQLEDEGKNPLIIDSKEPTLSFDEYALGENR